MLEIKQWEENVAHLPKETTLSLTDWLAEELSSAISLHCTDFILS